MFNLMYHYQPIRKIIYLKTPEKLNIDFYFKIINFLFSPKEERAQSISLILINFSNVLFAQFAESL